MPRLLLLLLAATALYGCNEVDSGYMSGLIEVGQASARRPLATQPATFRLDLELRNLTIFRVNNFHWAFFQVASTHAEFDLAPTIDVGCQEPDPWDVAPGESKVVSMEVNFGTDPARLTVACEVDATTGAFISDHDYEAPRTNDQPPAAFAGDVRVELRGTLDAPCTVDSCPMHATVSASVPVAAP